MKNLCFKKQKDIILRKDFIDDINEIIVHYGTMKKDGTMNKGSIKMIELGDDGLKIMKKIKEKKTKTTNLNEWV